MFSTNKKKQTQLQHLCRTSSYSKATTLNLQLGPEQSKLHVALHTMTRSQISYCTVCRSYKKLKKSVM